MSADDIFLAEASPIAATVENSLKLPYVFYKNKISITTVCVTFLGGDGVEGLQRKSI